MPFSNLTLRVRMERTQGGGIETDGLYAEDIKTLLAMRQKLVNNGNTRGGGTQSRCDQMRRLDYRPRTGRRRGRRTHRGRRTTGASGEGDAVSYGTIPLAYSRPPSGSKLSSAPLSFQYQGESDTRRNEQWSKIKIC